MSNKESQYKAISAVAEILSVEQHVIRFWEKQFTIAKPSKVINNRRYYTNHDIDNLLYIKSQLYDKGLTIHGLQKQLKLQPQNTHHDAAPSDGTPKPAYDAPSHGGGIDLPLQQKLLKLLKEITTLRQDMQAVIKEFTTIWLHLIAGCLGRAYFTLLYSICSPFT